MRHGISLRAVLSVMAALFWLVTATTADAVVVNATITGTVTNNSGKSGRVYLALKGNAGAWDTNIGVSVQPNGTNATTFTITGVPAGTYSLDAYLDITGTGMRHANDPYASIASVVVSSRGPST